MNTVLSTHAEKRMKERCGAGKKAAKRMGSLALERGVAREETKGPLRKWLDGRYTDEGGQIVVWGDKAYIYSGETVLITVLQVPQAIRKNMNKMITAKA